MSSKHNPHITIEQQQQQQKRQQISNDDVEMGMVNSTVTTSKAASTAASTVTSSTTSMERSDQVNREKEEETPSSWPRGSCHQKGMLSICVLVVCMLAAGSATFVIVTIDWREVPIEIVILSQVVTHIASVSFFVAIPLAHRAGRLYRVVAQGHKLLLDEPQEPPQAEWDRGCMIVEYLFFVAALLFGVYSSVVPNLMIIMVILAALAWGFMIAYAKQLQSLLREHSWRKTEEQQQLKNLDDDNDFI